MIASRDMLAHNLNDKPVQINRLVRIKMRGSSFREMSQTKNIIRECQMLSEKNHKLLFTVFSSNG